MLGLGLGLMQGWFYTVGAPQIRLLQSERWTAMRPQVCRALGRSASPAPAFHALAYQRDEAYQRTVANFPTNAPVVRSDVPALTRGRLSWVQHNYIHAEILTWANGCLDDTQATIALAQEWGGGEVASADGVRFVVPVRTLNAGPNRKYFNADCRVTYYNFTSDQCTGFHAIVIPGTRRDSLLMINVSRSMRRALL